MKNKLFITLIAVFAFIQVNAQTTASTDENLHTVIMPSQLPSLSDQNINEDEQEADPLIEIDSREIKPQLKCKMNERTMETDCKQMIIIQNQTDQKKQACNSCAR